MKCQIHQPLATDSRLFSFRLFLGSFQFQLFTAIFRLSRRLTFRVESPTRRRPRALAAVVAVHPSSLAAHGCNQVPPPSWRRWP